MSPLKFASVDDPDSPEPALARMVLKKNAELEDDVDDEGDEDESPLIGGSLDHLKKLLQQELKNALKGEEIQALIRDAAQAAGGGKSHR